VPDQAIAPSLAELTHSMQSLNTSVPSNVEVRLSLWEVGEEKVEVQPPNPSARYRKRRANSWTRRIEKQKPISVMQKV